MINRIKRLFKSKRRRTNTENCSGLPGVGEQTFKINFDVDFKKNEILFLQRDFKVRVISVPKMHWWQRFKKFIGLNYHWHYRVKKL